MAQAPSLPAADAVARMLRDLLGKAVTPKKVPAIGPSTRVCVATYIDDVGALAALCLCEVSLSASMGAALALIPPAVAAAAAKESELPPEIFDNLREVLNILSGQFGAVHLRLGTVLQPTAARSSEVRELAARPAARADFELTVAGYACGRLTLLTH